MVVMVQRENNKKLKRYKAAIFYNRYRTDVIIVWANNRKEAKRLLTLFYDHSYKHLTISMVYQPIATLLCRLFNKVPNYSVVYHK